MEINSAEYLSSPKEQDGAQPHYARGVHQYWDKIFPNRSISPLAVEWPAQSPDDNPTPFYMETSENRNLCEETKIPSGTQIRQIFPDISQNVINEFHHSIGLASIKVLNILSILYNKSYF